MAQSSSSVYVILCFSLFSCSVISLQCIDQCFIFRDEFKECSTQLLDNVSFAASVNLTFTSEFGSNSSIFDQNLLSSILALICHDQAMADEPSPPRLCYVTEPVTGAGCPSSINCNTSCFSVLLRVFNASSADEISSSEVVSILQKVESLTSLHLAGVPLIEVKSSETTESSTSDNIFNTVPIASWIFVAMGLIVSTLTVSKPVWWDRCFKRILSKSNTSI